MFLNGLCRRSIQKKIVRLYADADHNVFPTKSEMKLKKSLALIVKQRLHSMIQSRGDGNLPVSAYVCRQDATR